MRWDLKVVYIPGKNLRGTDALSRYGVRSNNDEHINGITGPAAHSSRYSEARIIVVPYQVVIYGGIPSYLLLFQKCYIEDNKCLLELLVFASYLVMLHSL